MGAVIHINEVIIMEIYIKEFNKRFEVKSSNKNVKATYTLQLKMAQAEDAEDKPAVEQIKLTLQLTDDTENYVADILRLNKQQKEKLDDMDNDVTIGMANHIAMRLMGMTEEDIKKANEEDVDPKK